MQTMKGLRWLSYIYENIDVNVRPRYNVPRRLPNQHCTTIHVEDFAGDEAGILRAQE
jgi:hypothetical protein